MEQDFQRRDQLLGIDTYRMPVEDIDVDVETVKTLEREGFVWWGDGGTPALGDLVNLAEENDGVRLCGYVITPEREDTEVVVDCLKIPIELVPQVFEWIVNSVHFGDYLSSSHIVRAGQDGKWFYLRWE